MAEDSSISAPTDTLLAAWEAYGKPNSSKFASGMRPELGHCRRLVSWLPPDRPTECGQPVCSADNLLYPDLRPCSASAFPGQAGQKGYPISIIGWIVLGLIAGFIASKVVNQQGEGLVLDIILGIIGAVVGGFLFNQLGAAGVTGFNIYSMFVAVIGAIVVLVIYHLLTGRRAVR